MINLLKPFHEILVIIAYGNASSEGSDEPHQVIVHACIKNNFMQMGELPKFYELHVCKLM